MDACAECGQPGTVRLFGIRTRRQVRRVWLCPACAFDANRRGVYIEPSPAWIERAALNLLPVKEQGLEPDPGHSPTERYQRHPDRPRSTLTRPLMDRRRSAPNGRRVAERRSGSGGSVRRVSATD